MYIPSSNNLWLEFKKNDKTISISKIKAMYKEHIEETLSNIPRQKEFLYWTVDISKKVFVDVVLDSTDNFVEEIIHINKILVEAKDVTSLLDIYQKSKKYI